MKMTLNRTITECPRCGLGHPRLAVREFTKPVYTTGDAPFNFWGTCPTTNEPLVVRTRASDIETIEHEEDVKFLRSAEAAFALAT